MQRNDNQNALHTDKLKQIVGGTENIKTQYRREQINISLFSQHIYTCTIISPEQAIAFPKQ